MLDYALLAVAVITSTHSANVHCDLLVNPRLQLHIRKRCGLASRALVSIIAGTDVPSAATIVVGSALSGTHNGSENWCELLEQWSQAGCACTDHCSCELGLRPQNDLGQTPGQIGEAVLVQDNDRAHAKDTDKTGDGS